MNLNVPDWIAAHEKDATGDAPKARTRATRKGPSPFSADELLKIGKDIAAQWFRPPETSCLTLMEIDPWNVHAYWKIAEADLAAARARLPGQQGRDAALMLRFTDISPRQEGVAPHEQFDIEVHQASNNWYVNLWRDAWHYSAELGLRAADGAFISLLRSNEVAAPRAGPSPELDFRELEVCSPRHLESAQGAGRSAVGDLLLKDLFPKRLQPHDDFPLALAETEYSGASFDEPEFPSLNEETEDADEFVDILQQLAQDAEMSGSGAGFAVREPSGHFPFIAATEIASYRDLARETRHQVLTSAPSPLPPLPRMSLEAVAPTDVELLPQPLPIPIPVPPATESGSANTLVGATDGDTAITAGVSLPAAVGSASAGRPPVPLEAFLADTVFSHGQGDSPALVAAHVVIEGQAAPDTPLMLFGKRVQLRADRSFTLRLPLQRGPELAALLHQLRGRYGDWGEG
jgi:hypothetical protein